MPEEDPAGAPWEWLPRGELVEGKRGGAPL